MPGYVSSFGRPEPMDPNDRKRQQTQSRADNYPYDMPVMYGAPIGTDDGGAAYQRSPDTGPPDDDMLDPSQVRPKSVWDNMADALDLDLEPRDVGPTGPDADALGYGSHGRMGEEGDDDMDLMSVFCPDDCGGEGDDRPSPTRLTAILIDLDTDDDPDEDDGEDDFLNMFHDGGLAFADHEEE